MMWLKLFNLDPWNEGSKIVLYVNLITGCSNKEGIVTSIESLLQEYHIVGSVDSKGTPKQVVKMALEKKVTHKPKKTEMPLLIAARMGVTEMVESILEKFPVSIQDVDADNKNVLLLAVEHRQTHTFRFLVQRKTPLHESVFRQWDNQGNNALHLAATYGEYRPWLIPGSALQMQWELKWYKVCSRHMARSRHMAQASWLYIIIGRNLIFILYI